MKRSLKFSLKLANTNKRKKLDALWISYNQLLRDFLNRLFSKQDLSEEYIKSCETELSYRYRQCVKRQAFKIFKSWCRNKKRKKRPELKSPCMILDYRFVELQKNKNSFFDFWVKIATLEKGNPTFLPVKSYKYANKYFQEWNLAKGGRLIKKNGEWLLILTFEKEVPKKKNHGKKLGIDIGYRKLITTSEGKVIADRIKELTEKSTRRKQGSKNWEQTNAEIKQYIYHAAKQLFDGTIETLVIENLKNLKKNKHGKWSRKVNRKFNFWSYGLLINRIKELAELHGVRVVPVSSQYTSQRCPLCGHIERLNRRGETFHCQLCGFAHDADYVGSLNILSRFTGEPIVPQMIKATLDIFL